MDATDGAEIFPKQNMYWFSLDWGVVVVKPVLKTFKKPLCKIIP